MSERDWLTRLTSTLDQHIRGVQFGLYGVGVVGLCVAIRSVRPFQKLSNASNIPQSFIRKSVPLSGVVKNAQFEDGAAVLLVNHKPLISLGQGKSGPYLPVKLAGVMPTMNGLSWLNITLEKQPVTFTVVATDLQAALAFISHQDQDVGSKMVQLGLASVQPYDSSLENNVTYKRLYKQLLRCERNAELHGNGIWWGHAPFYIKLLDKTCSRLRLLAVGFLPRKLAAPLLR